MKWLIASFLIFLLGIFNVFAPVRGTTQYLFAPVQYGLQQLAFEINDVINFFSKLTQIRSENISLLEKNENFRSELLELRDLEEENLMLREQLRLQDSNNDESQLVLAKTLGSTAGQVGTMMILDKGEAYGIAKDDIVVKGNYLVGKVVNVTKNRSEVELITSPTLVITVIDSQTKTEGVSKGQFGTSMKMSRILPSEQVNVGDIILTSGRDGIFLPDLIVGEVTDVSEQSAEVLREANIHSIISLNSLRKVFVISSK